MTRLRPYQLRRALLRPRPGGGSAPISAGAPRRPRSVRRGRSSGAIAIELVLVAPAVVFLLLLGVAGGRLSGAQALVNDAAVSGARAASLAPGQAEALTAAQTVIDAALQPPVAGSGSADCADFDPQTDIILTYGPPPPPAVATNPPSFQAGGTVTVPGHLRLRQQRAGPPHQQSGMRARPPPRPYRSVGT